MLVSIALHSVVLFGISFVVIQSPWKLNEATIVNIKFADADFDAKGQSHQGFEDLHTNKLSTAMQNQDVNSQDSSKFSIRRLESNSTLESYETIYLNSWQRKVETAGYHEISDSNFIKGNFRVQIKTTIDHEGNLLSADILYSSGNKMLDALALRILKQSAPFQPFSQDMLSRYKQLEIVRDWNFTTF